MFLFFLTAISQISRVENENFNAVVLRIDCKHQEWAYVLKAIFLHVLHTYLGGHLSKP